MKKLFLILFCFGFFCDGNNIGIDAEGNPYIESDAEAEGNKASTLDDKSNHEDKKDDGIIDDSLKAKNADVLK